MSADLLAWFRARGVPLQPRRPRRLADVQHDLAHWLDVARTMPWRADHAHRRIDALLTEWQRLESEDR